MVNMYKLELTLLQQAVLRFLFIKPDISFTARALAKSLEVSQPAISKALPLMEKKGFVILNKDKESKRFSICLNRDNRKVMQLKRAENIKFVYECGLVDFLEDNFPGTTILLFGSYSRGDDITNSDIDIAVIGAKGKDLNISNFEKFLQREIRINFYDSFKQIHKGLKENLCNGIVLVGGIEL